MSYTSTDLTAVQRAIAKGELRVDFADRSVTYRSIDELLQAEARIAGALAAADTTSRSKLTRLVADKGF